MNYTTIFLHFHQRARNADLREPFCHGAFFIMLHCSRHFLRAFPRTFRISLFRRRRLSFLPPTSLSSLRSPEGVRARDGGGGGSRSAEETETAVLERPFTAAAATFSRLSSAL